jgi:hypothetical protein
MTPVGDDTRDQVGRALELLAAGLAPFVVRNMRAGLNCRWQGWKP